MVWEQGRAFSLRILDCRQKGKALRKKKKKKPGPHPHPYEIPKGGALKLAQTWSLREPPLLRGTGNFWRTLYPSEMGSWRRGLEAETESK